MSELEIRLYGDPVLREPSRELREDELDAEFRALLDQMGATMYGASGIGLAANQIGETRRFFVADVAQAEDQPRRGGKRVRDPKKRDLRAYLNPEVLESSIEDEAYQEGCLSIPEVEADVFRPIRIKVRYRDADWNLHEEWIDGLLARVFQHELDHLDGVLFVDRLPEAQRRKLAGALNKLKKQQTESTISQS